MQKSFTIKTKVWLYPGKAAWHFVSVPRDTTKEIDYFFAHQKRGWGSLPVKVTIGATSWKTSIFADKKTETYLLPIKADIRKKEGIVDNSMITCTLEIIT